MIFDKLCGILERHKEKFPYWYNLLDNIPLFWFPYIPHKILNEYNFNDFDWELFHLPYSAIAVEDQASLILVADCEDEQIGINKPRKFLEVFDFKQDSEAFNPEKKIDDPYNEELKETFRNLKCLQVSDGIIESMEYNNTNNGFLTKAYVNKISILTKESEMLSINLEEDTSLDKESYFLKKSETVQNVQSCLEEIAYIYTSKHFVLEEKPTTIDKNKKQKKQKKISRSHQRPIYTIMKPYEIRDKLNIQHPSKTRNSPVPHERRRHLRRLRKESGYKEDKIIVVKASWIGQSEKQIGNKIYKVKLDI